MLHMPAYPCCLAPTKHTCWHLWLLDCLSKQFLQLLLAALLCLFLLLHMQDSWSHSSNLTSGQAADYLAFTKQCLTKTKQTLMSNLLVTDTAAAAYLLAKLLLLYVGLQSSIKKRIDLAHQHLLHVALLVITS